MFADIAFDEKYKFYNANSYYDYNTNLADSSWNQLDFVSMKNNEIIGFLSAKIDRGNDSVSSLRIINFYEMNLTFSKDFHQFLTDLFTKFNFRKICFSVVIGNPAEKMYDKYIREYSGRIVGTYKEEVKLYDGKYYDFKVYELFKNDFERVK